MKNKELTQNLAKEHLAYNFDTGIFTWLKPNCNRVSVGQEAGCIDAHGYRVIYLCYRRVLAHRLAWLYVHGEWPNQIDHINGVRHDNRISNLRSVTHKENAKNMRPTGRSKTGVTGVDIRAGKYRARIRAHGKHVHLGYFEDLESAKRAREEAKKRYGFQINHGVDKIED